MFLVDVVERRYSVLMSPKCPLSPPPCFSCSPPCMLPLLLPSALSSWREGEAIVLFFPLALSLICETKKGCGALFILCFSFSPPLFSGVGLLRRLPQLGRSLKGACFSAASSWLDGCAYWPPVWVCLATLYGLSFPPFLPPPSSLFLFSFPPEVFFSRHAERRPLLSISKTCKFLSPFSERCFCDSCLFRTEIPAQPFLLRFRACSPFPAFPNVQVPFSKVSPLRNLFSTFDLLDEVYCLGYVEFSSTPFFPLFFLLHCASILSLSTELLPFPRQNIERLFKPGPVLQRGGLACSCSNLDLLLLPPLPSSFPSSKVMCRK